MYSTFAFSLSTLVGITISLSSYADDLRHSPALPSAGSHELRIVSPDVLELRITASRRGHEGRPSHADWISDETHLPNADMPSAADLSVNGGALSISATGFRRSVLYAPLGGSEFTLQNSLLIQLTTPLDPGALVTVTNPAGDKWPTSFDFSAALDENRPGPAIHVNQVGYEVGALKRAHIGYWLGDLGELDLVPGTAFEIIDAATSAASFSGTLSARQDTGYIYTPAPYQEVLQADFTSFDVPGDYRLRVPGLGASFPFVIGAGIDGAFARNDATGLYHQRSGTAKTLPYSRHCDTAGHTAPAEIPSNSNRNAFSSLWDFVQSQTGGAVTGPADLLYPFVATGTVDVAGGHHDAGDYGKYTVNSAQAVHALTFAIDHFAGAASLDNLGVPESGDGIGDLLQAVKTEAGFLAKMQDSDGGFYLLVRPRDRSFETDVLPSSGDTQVVYPKNTTATAAGVAALAELGSSPTFAAAFPTEAAAYLAAASSGWTFLQTAISDHGLAGSYQKIANSGESWGHEDELAWAAAALYSATGDSSYQTALTSWLPASKLTQNTGDPLFGAIRDFGFKRAAEGWGCALRAYAFGHRSGRIPLTGYDATYLAAVETELTAAADDFATWTANTAYGAALATKFKQDGAAAFFFPASEAFDALAGLELDPSEPSYLVAVRENLNFVAGNNPNDMPYSTGLGWRRQREIVSQFGQNDDSTLPPNGIPLGAITTGPPYLSTYQDDDGGNLLSRSLYPNVGVDVFPYYDRWSDSYQVTQEMTIPVLARSAAVSSALFAASPASTQSWSSAAATISGVPPQVDVGSTYTASLSTTLAGGRTTWDATAVQPQHGNTFDLVPVRPGTNIIAADRILYDGRRTAARLSFNATLGVPNPIESYTADPATDFDVIAWYQLDGDFSDAKNLQPAATPSGGTEAFDNTSFTWSTRPSGQALRLEGAGDGASVSIPSFFVDPNRASAISVEAMIMFDGNPETSQPLLHLVKPDTAAELIWGFDENLGPYLNGGTLPLMTDNELAPLYLPNVWHHLKIEIATDPFAGYRIWIDGELVHETETAEFSNWDLDLAAVLTFGNFTGWIDEVMVRSVGTVGPPGIAPLGEDELRLRVGETFVDPGAEAYDYLGNSLSITTSGTVDTSTPGTYVITYSATDSDGYTSTATLIVTVDLAPVPGERVAVYRFEGHPADSTSRQVPLALSGGANVSGGRLQLGGATDSATASVAAGDLFDATLSFGFALEFDICLDAFPTGDADLMVLSNGSESIQLKKLAADAGASLPGIATAGDLGLHQGETHHLRVVLTLDGFTVSVDGTEVAIAAGDPTPWAGTPITVTFDGFSGAIDNFILTNIHPYVTGTTLTSVPSQNFATMGDRQLRTILEADLYVDGVSDGLAIEGDVMINALPGYGVDTAKVLGIEQNYNSYFYFGRDTWSTGASTWVASLDEIATPAQLDPLLPLTQFHHVVVRLDAEGYQVWVDNRLVSQADDRSALARWENNNDAEFEVGTLDGSVSGARAVRLEFPPEGPYGSWAFHSVPDAGARDPECDADCDGSTNLEEFLFGSDPGDATSAPDIHFLQIDGEDYLEYRVSIAAASVSDFVLECSTDLATWVASPESPSVVGSDGSTTILRQSLSSGTRKFYRVTVSM